MANVTLREDTLETKDRMHLLDMLDLGLIDASWRDRLPLVLAQRLQELISNPR